MGSKFFKRYRLQQGSKHIILSKQQTLIQKHYSFLKCQIKENVLVCTGWIASLDYAHKYKVEISCTAGNEPHCKILEPSNIIPSQNIHMYDDYSLCLHYPPDKKWTSWTPIYQFTIPWLLEWIIYYEIFLLNGGYWEGPESPCHFSEDEKNIKIDIEGKQ